MNQRKKNQRKETELKTATHPHDGGELMGGMGDRERGRSQLKRGKKQSS